MGYYKSMYNKKDVRIFYDPKVLASTCDVIRVMCYDLYFAPHESTWGPTSTYPWAKEAMLFWINHIPGKKLVMGLPAYSNDYPATGGPGRQVYASAPDSVGGSLPSPVWMGYDRINVYPYDDINGRPRIFYASDAKSTEALLELADELDIRNIGFWHLGSVDSQMWEVVRKWVAR